MQFFVLMIAAFIAVALLSSLPASLFTNALVVLAIPLIAFLFIKLTSPY